MTDPLQTLRAIALQLPETEERLSHGQPTFFVAGKQFAQFREDHHGDDRIVACVKSGGLDKRAMLLASDPQAYSRPAHLYRGGWISINLADEIADWNHVADRVATSWELAAPRRLLEAGGR